MLKSEARESIKKLNADLMSLNPSALITMFEIDVTDIAFDLGIDVGENTVFRFHNVPSLFSTDIFWKGIRYSPAPVRAEGFELNAKGIVAAPKLSISSNEEGIVALATLKSYLRDLNDLVGARVTRRRTLAKYIDDVNFIPNEFAAERPYGFAQDWNAEFPPDVYYIYRKSNENKFLLEYELGSPIDVQGIQLPNRLVSKQRCLWQYRGNGCFWENVNNYLENPEVFENCGESVFPQHGAPPVANTQDQLIIDSLEVDELVYKGLWNSLTTYVKGDYVYLKKDGISFYFASKQNSNLNHPPPNKDYWMEDQCSKTVRGCKLRHGTSLPYGGFYTVHKYEG